jgi:hypothetical protein
LTGPGWATVVNSTPGATNTGSGGGGGGSFLDTIIPGAGGSGIVMIRYAIP